MSMHRELVGITEGSDVGDALEYIYKTRPMGGDYTEDSSRFSTVNLPIENKGDYYTVFHLNTKKLRKHTINKVCGYVLELKKKR